MRPPEAADAPAEVSQLVKSAIALEIPVLRYFESRWGWAAILAPDLWVLSCSRHERNQDVAPIDCGSSRYSTTQLFGASDSLTSPLRHSGSPDDSL